MVLSFCFSPVSKLSVLPECCYFKQLIWFIYKLISWKRFESFCVIYLLPASVSAFCQKQKEKLKLLEFLGKHLDLQFFFPQKVMTNQKKPCDKNDLKYLYICLCIYPDFICLSLNFVSLYFDLSSLKHDSSIQFDYTHE